MSQEQDASSGRERLGSWKEIAAYLGVEVRTAQRWERSEGLPIHRHAHVERGTVHAYRDELDKWRLRRLKPPGRVLRWRWLIAAAAALALAGAVIVWLVVLKSPVGSPEQRPVFRASRLFACATREGARVRLIPVGRDPRNLAITPDGSELYVANFEAAAVSVIHAATLRVIHTIQLPDQPRGMAMSADGRKVYVAMALSDISVIDTGRKSVTVVRTGGNEVIDLALTPDGRMLYMTMGHQGLKRMITAARRVEPVLSPACPMYVAMHPDGRLMVVDYQCGGPGGRPGHDAIDFVDAATGQSTGTLTGPPLVGGPLAFAQDGSQVWVSGGDACESARYDHEGCPVVPGGVAHVVRTSDRKVIRSIGLPPPSLGPLVFSPDSSWVLAGGSPLNVISTADYTPLETTSSLGTDTASVVFSADGKRAFLAAGGNTVAVLDLTPREAEPSVAGLRSCWRADGNANDAHYGTNGALRGGAGFAPGVLGQAFSFDGKGSMVDFGPRSLSLFPFQGEGSVAAWVKLSGLAARGGSSIVDRLAEDGRAGWKLFVRPDGRFGFCMGGPAGRGACDAGSRTAVFSETAAQPGKWYFVAGVKTREALSLYIGGKPEAKTVPGAFQNDPASVELRIGAGQKGEFLSGLVDEVAIYLRALSPAEIESQFRAVTRACEVQP